MRIRISKTQAILAYTVLIAVIIAAVLAMSSYLKRRLQGSYKKAADVYGLGEQFQP